MNTQDKSVRGYYYNLSLSPYSYKGYKFPSAKKLELFIKALEKYIKKAYETTNFLNAHSDTKLNFEMLSKEITDKLYNELKQNF